MDKKDGILITVRYSEPLSLLLRALPGSRWDAEHQRWRYPFSSSDEIRRALPEIERLAILANEAPERETERREVEKARIEQLKEGERRSGEQRRAMGRPRPLQPHYMNVIPERPRFALMLEAIADNLRNTGLGGGFKSRCWVAQIFGSDGNGGWARAFINGARDYARSNSVGSRGIYINYFLEEGPIYEVSSPQSWRSTERYFLRIINGQEKRMTKQEVEECLVK